MLADSFGRIATDLRVSVTDRCNLRCSYCMPAEGLDWLPSPALLTDGEMGRLITIAVQRLGITEVRFTGGEPLLRRGLAGLIAAAAALRPRPEISLTTNGIGLARLAGPLRDAGLDRINVSLDTLSPETFVTLARRDRLADVLAGLSAAAAAGLAPVKVNAVLMRGVNDHEAAPLLRFCLDRGYQLRFIEQMPLDAQHGWRRTDMITADEILAALSARFSLTPADPASRGSAPAETFLVDQRPAHGRRDRLGHPAVLRSMRPGPANRRRPDPQLPVRQGRERPAHAAAGRSRRRPASRHLAPGGRRQAARARHQRPRLPAARPADVSHRRLTAPRSGQPAEVARARPASPGQVAACPVIVEMGTARIGQCASFAWPP